MSEGGGSTGEKRRKKFASKKGLFMKGTGMNKTKEVSFKHKESRARGPKWRTTGGRKEEACLPSRKKGKRTSRKAREGNKKAKQRGKVYQVPYARNQENINNNQ